VKHRLLFPVLLLAALSIGMLAACKQSQGERCQVTADCEEGLTCNQGQNPPVCQGSEGANPIDGSVPDADPDGPVDATDATDATDAPPDTL
jgi:hypothetical protein